jgi:hypothetical protein
VESDCWLNVALKLATTVGICFEIGSEIDSMTIVLRFRP